MVDWLGGVWMAKVCRPLLRGSESRQGFRQSVQRPKVLAIFATFDGKTQEKTGQGPTLGHFCGENRRKSGDFQHLRSDKKCPVLGRGKVARGP